MFWQGRDLIKTGGAGPLSRKGPPGTARPAATRKAAKSAAASRRARRRGPGKTKGPAPARRPFQTMARRLRVALDRAGAAAGTGRAATAAAAEFHAGRHRETHIGHVDLERRSLFVEFLFYDKRKTGNVKHLVRIARLIQSQR